MVKLCYFNTLRYISEGESVTFVEIEVVKCEVFWDLTLFRESPLKPGKNDHIKTQFVPHRKHITSPLQSPTG
jgi:hypothetical protein